VVRLREKANLVEFRQFSLNRIFRRIDLVYPAELDQYVRNINHGKSAYIPASARAVSADSELAGSMHTMRTYMHPERILEKKDGSSNVCLQNRCYRPKILILSPASSAKRSYHIKSRMMKR
jgi:hypothetical protein